MAQAAHEVSGMRDPGDMPDTAATELADVRKLPPIRGAVSVGRASIGWTLEVPLNPTSEAMNIFIPGFGGFKATSREPRRELSEYGASVSYGPARTCGSKIVQKLLNSPDAHVATLEAITDSIIHNEDAIKTLGALGINPLLQWLVAHSFGGASSTRYALEHSDRVVGKTDLATIGFNAPSVWSLMSKFPPGIIPGIMTELIPYAKSGHIDANVRSLFQATEYYLRDPIRTLGEIYTCLSIDLRDDTRRLTDSGVNTGYIGAEHDCVVVPNEANAQYVRQFGIMPGSGHLFAQLKAARMARQVHRQQTGKEFDFTDYALAT